MSSGWLDLRVALRQCRRRAGFAVTVVSTLALTIGATTGVFATVEAVLLRALPFADPDRLVYVTSVRPDQPTAPFSLPEFMDYRARAHDGQSRYSTNSGERTGRTDYERFARRDHREVARTAPLGSFDAR